MLIEKEVVIKSIGTKKVYIKQKLCLFPVADRHEWGPSASKVIYEESVPKNFAKITGKRL